MCNKLQIFDGGSLVCSVQRIFGLPYVLQLETIVMGWGYLCLICLALEHARLTRHWTCYGQLVALSTCGDATWLPSKPSSHWAGNAFACLASLSNPSVQRSSTCDNRNTMKTLITRWLMEWEAGYCLEAEAVCPCVCPVYAIDDLPIVLVLWHWNTILL